ncbi:hypothetical protein BJ912DRAFT_234654 [Pholiota molesta]|nr:hypothetical protein BJ912DRAFT_234654 [Pholiota molesta]
MAPRPTTCQPTVSSFRRAFVSPTQEQRDAYIVTSDGPTYHQHLRSGINTSPRPTEPRGPASARSRRRRCPSGERPMLRSPGSSSMRTTAHSSRAAGVPWTTTTRSRGVGDESTARHTNNRTKPTVPASARRMSRRHPHTSGERAIRAPQLSIPTPNPERHTPRSATARRTSEPSRRAASILGEQIGGEQRREVHGQHGAQNPRSTDSAQLIATPQRRDDPENGMGDTHSTTRRRPGAIGCPTHGVPRTTTARLASVGDESIQPQTKTTAKHGTREQDIRTTSAHVDIQIVRQGAGATVPRQTGVAAKTPLPQRTAMAMRRSARYTDTEA